MGQTNRSTNFRRLYALRGGSRVGGTIVETVIAMSIIVVFFSGLYSSVGHVWVVLRSGLESNAANRTVNGRAEQLRACTWAQITDASYLASNVFSSAPDAAGDLGALTETIDIIAYPTPSPNPPALQVIRTNSTGAVNILGNGNGAMPAQQSVRLNLTAAWTAKGSRPRIRQISMIFAQGGISGRK